MENLVNGWIDSAQVSDLVIQCLKRAHYEQHPNECAFSAIVGAGEILRRASEPPDDATIDRVLGNLLDMLDRGGDPGAANLETSKLRAMIFDQDTANRYLRILIHCAAMCMAYTAEAYVGNFERADVAEQGTVAAGRALAEEAACLSAIRLSPYAVMMTMVSAGWQHALDRGLHPLQVMKGMVVQLQLVLGKVPLE